MLVSSLELDSDLDLMPGQCLLPDYGGCSLRPLGLLGAAACRGPCCLLGV